MSARRYNTKQKRAAAYSPRTSSMPLTCTSRQSKFTFFEFGLMSMFLFLISQPQQTEAHIMIYSRLTSQLIEEYNDLPAQFGPSLPGNGFRLYVIPASPNNGCDVMLPPANLTDTTIYPETARFAAIIQRGGTDCTFEMKVRNAQAANYSAAIIYNNNGDDLEQMSAQNSTGIRIPSVFVGHTTGINLQTFFTPEIIIVINDELPFNINTQLILPFSILIGICFLIMIFYMIYKCIREERRLRRYRLPKSMLKKLPILKYTKNSDLNYDTCVICLDEFVEGDKLRVLPCRHPYHSHCIDPWLTENRRVCPVCKRKVFTKGEARSSRNRQSSLDSLTDTDDDTTPLLQQRGADATTRRSRGTSTNATTTTAATALAETTRHGTFRRVGNATEAAVSDSNSPAENTSDDENMLLTHQSPARNANRVNPFDRAPNLPPHLAEQLSENRHSIWSLPIFSFFRHPESISVAAPPYLEEVIHDDTSMLSVHGNRSASLPLAATQPPTHSSNNILNPNLSGSFKDESDHDNDDDDINAEQPQRSIYEPINNDNNSSNNTNTTTTNINNTTPATVTSNDRNDRNDRNISDAEVEALALFVQTPTSGGIGVAALPNPNIHDLSVGTRPATNHRGRRHFLI